MKIAVFGATGRVGSLVVKHAIKRGFAVKALVRDRSKAEAMIPDAELIVGDTKEEAAVRQTLDGCDLVFSGLSTDKTDTLTTSFPHIIRVMKEKGISRIVTIGTAGILNSRHEEGNSALKPMNPSGSRHSLRKNTPRFIDYCKRPTLNGRLSAPLTFLTVEKKELCVMK